MKKLVKESLNEVLFVFPISELSYDEILRAALSQNPSEKSLSLPSDFMSSRVIYSEKQFDTWYKTFIEDYGDEGELQGVSFYNSIDWRVVGNPEWDRLSKTGGENMSKIYGKSGNWTGD